MAWEYFRGGTVVREAGVKVVELVRSDPHNRDRTLYEVRCLTCGRRIRLSHRAIQRRAQARKQKCGSCSKKGLPSLPAPALRPYGVMPPDWPRPPSVPAGRRGWLP